MVIGRAQPRGCEPGIGQRWLPASRKPATQLLPPCDAGVQHVDQVAVHGDAHREGAAGGDDLLQPEVVTAHAKERDRITAGVDRQQHTAVVGAGKRALRGERVDGRAGRDAAHAAGGVGAGQGKRAVPGALIDHDRVGGEIVRLYEQVLLRVSAPARGEGARGGGKHERKDDHHGRAQGERQEGLGSFHGPSRSMSAIAQLWRSLGFPHTVSGPPPRPRPTPDWRPCVSQAHPPRRESAASLCPRWPQQGPLYVYSDGNAGSDSRFSPDRRFTGFNFCIRL